MAEIKGQILGVVLVLAIFGVVGGVMVYSFQSASNNIANKITSASEDTIEPVNPADNVPGDAGRSTDFDLALPEGLMKF